MRKEDWKRNLPNGRERNIKAIHTGNRKQSENDKKINTNIPEQKKSFKLFSGKSGFINLATLLSLMYASYLTGHGFGKDYAEDRYPQEYSNLQTSLQIAEKINVDLSSKTQTLNDQLDRANQKIEELESSINKLENVPKVNKTESTTVNKKENVISEYQTESYYNEEIFISLNYVSIMDGLSSTITANVLNYPSKEYKDLRVGSKVYYETDNSKYEIRVTSIGHSTATIAVTKLPN